MDNHSHAASPFKISREFLFALLCGVFLFLGFAFSFIKEVPFYVSLIFYIICYFFGGYYTAIEAYHGIRNKKFDIDFLMLVAALGAAALNEWAEGGLLLFLFSIGHSLEHYAMDRAKKSIEALADLAPKTALLKINNDYQEVPIEKLQPGDTILIKPNSKIAADGIVVHGSSSVNQAPITGESIPVDKIAVDLSKISTNPDKLDQKFRVFAGSINGSHAIEIQVSKKAEDSTISRLIKLVNEAQSQKSPTQHFTDNIVRYYVPIVLIIVTLLLFAFLIIEEPFSASFYRAMSVLVAASPCALAISTPSAILSGVARAARGGVLVKGGKPLEDLGSLDTIAFDKTGTLTEGKPKLTGVYPVNQFNRTELLKTIAAVEKLSDHPLAAAAVEGALAELDEDVEPAKNMKAITGRGVQAEYNGAEIRIGNKELFLENDHKVSQEIIREVEKHQLQGNTTMLVQKDNDLIGILTIMDIAREDAQETLQRLQQIGIKKMVMLTGDNQQVADSVAKNIGITQAIGNLLPEQKLDVIKDLQKQGKVAMVGDGVNDAPAMATSSVGIAMGAAGSDVALETADIALMADKLNTLPFAIALSRKARTIIKENLFISLGMVALLIPLTILGKISMGPAVIGHEGSTVLVVFNALRLLAFRSGSGLTNR